MRSFPHPNDSTGLLSRIAAYIAGVALVVAAMMAGLADIAGTSEKIGSAPRLMSATIGAAAKTDGHEISAAHERNPVWIAPTTRYDYKAPPQRAAKAAAKTAFKPKPKAKPRAQPDADGETQAYGYAAQPRRSVSFESPFFRDSVR